VYENSKTVKCFKTTESVQQKLSAFIIFSRIRHQWLTVPPLEFVCVRLFFGGA